MHKIACASTTCLLKTKKCNAWKQFCTKINPSLSIKSLWVTAKRFRNWFQPLTRWFHEFFVKVVPCYVPSEKEVSIDPSTTRAFSLLDNCLSLSFTLGELNTVINFCKPIAFRFNYISLVILQHSSTHAIEILLSIINNLFDSNKVPDVWTSYKVTNPGFECPMFYRLSCVN